MGQGLGTVLPLAVAIAVFPVPIVTVVLMLASDRGRSNGLAFVLAWFAGLAAVGFDHFPAKSAGTGFALTALNPKNVVLMVAAAGEIAGVGLQAGEEVALLLALVLIASFGVLTPLVLALALGDRSRQPLDALRSWMARNNAVIMTVIFVLIGAKLIGDAITGFSD